MSKKAVTDLRLDVVIFLLLRVGDLLSVLHNTRVSIGRVTANSHVYSSSFDPGLMPGSHWS